MIIPHPDKFGYYNVNGRKTYSKFEALEWQKASGHFPVWDFNQHVFDQFNWKIEPSLSLWDLYKLRACQIRDSYDYCVIFYSGGSDSHNLLSAWIEADCKIDEIATFHYYSGSDDKHSYMNGEVTRVALPYLNNLANRVEFKQRVIDMSNDVVNLIKHDWLDYKYMTNGRMSPNNVAKAHWRETISDYANLISAGKKVCFIWGSEKPRVFYDGNFYLQFLDFIDNCVGPYSQRNFANGFFDELFYWTPDLPELISKQAHTVKKFCETVNDGNFYQDSSTVYGFNPTISKYITENTIKQILYPKWDPTTFCDGKPPSFVWSLRDQWLINGNINESSKFKNISTDILTSIDPYWLDDPTNGLRGIKAHCSPKYYIS